MAQSAGAVEYNDSISGEMLDFPNKSVRDMTINHLIMKLRYWNFGERRGTLTLPFLSDPIWPRSGSIW